MKGRVKNKAEMKIELQKSYSTKEKRRAVERERRRASGWGDICHHQEPLIISERESVCLLLILFLTFSFSFSSSFLVCDMFLIGSEIFGFPPSSEQTHKKSR